MIFDAADREQALKWHQPRTTSDLIAASARTDGGGRTVLAQEICCGALDALFRGATLRVVSGREKERTMVTLEIGGAPVAMIEADKTDALAFFEPETFKQDMRRWVSDWRPLWDGRDSNS